MPNREEKSERDRDDWFAEPEAPSAEWPLTAEERRDEALPAGGAELEDWLQDRPQSAARSRRTLAGPFGARRLTWTAVLLFICLLIGLAAAGVFGGQAHRSSAVTAGAAPASQLTASSAPAPFTPPRPKSPVRALKRGARGPPVIALQRELARLGYYAGRIDGQFGPGTESALSRFQTVSGLTPDGILGPKTRRALKSALER
jgi:hypothetical protein